MKITPTMLRRLIREVAIDNGHISNLDKNKKDAKYVFSLEFVVSVSKDEDPQELKKILTKTKENLCLKVKSDLKNQQINVLEVTTGKENFHKHFGWDD